MSPDVGDSEVWPPRGCFAKTSESDDPMAIFISEDEYARGMKYEIFDCRLLVKDWHGRGEGSRSAERRGNEYFYRHMWGFLGPCSEKTAYMGGKRGIRFGETNVSPPTPLQIMFFNLERGASEIGSKR
jgi:hypothetical protein